MLEHPTTIWMKKKLFGKISNMSLEMIYTCDRCKTIIKTHHLVEIDGLRIDRYNTSKDWELCDSCTEMVIDLVEKNKSLSS